MVHFSELCGPVLDELEAGRLVEAHNLFMAAMAEVWPGWSGGPVLDT